MESKGSLITRRHLQDMAKTNRLDSVIDFLLRQGSVPRWRPPRGVSGRWPGVEGEVGQTKGPGDLPVPGQEQRRDADAEVPTDSARSLLVFCPSDTRAHIYT